MTNFNIEIISLAGDHARKRFQKAQMLRLGLKASFLDATTPDDLPKEMMEKLTSAWARPLRQTEVALTHSHRTAWKRVLSANRPTLILEDDAVLCESLPTVLSELSSMSGLEFVQLETFNVPKLIDKNLKALLSSPYEIGRLYRDRGGAAAYLVWPDAAQKLVHSLEKSYPPADAAIHLASKIQRHQMVPACAVQAMHVSEESSYYKNVRHIAASSVSAVPKPSYENMLQWLRHKTRRMLISVIILKKTIVSKKLAGYRFIAFTGD